MPYHTPHSAAPIGSPAKINPWLLGFAVGILTIIGIIFVYILGYNPF